MGAIELPACCRACQLYESQAGHCLLLAHPTEDNRRRLLTMPCNVQALLARRIEPAGRAALEARRFTPGEPTDGRALEALRQRLRRPGLSFADFRVLYRTGANESLRQLAQSDALGEKSMRRFEGAFRRVLRIEDGGR